MKKPPVLIAVLFLLFPLISSPAPAETVKVGVLISPGEGDAETDASYLRGAEIAAAEINASEGRQGTCFLLLIRKVPQAMEGKGLRDLFFEEKIQFLIGAVRYRTVLPVCRAAGEQGIPFLVFPKDFMEARSTGQEPPNLFWISPAPEAFQRAAVRTAVQFPGKRIYLLARDSDAGRNWARYFWEELFKQKPDAQRAGESFLPAGVHEYEPYLQTILSAAPEICVSDLGSKEWLSFYRVARSEGYFKKVIHVELLAGALENLSALKKKAPDGIWGVTAFPFWALEEKEARDFVSKYRRNTGVYPGLSALSGYLSIHALFEGVRKSGGVGRNVAGSLEGLTLATPLGPIGIRKNDHRAVWPIWVGSTQYVSDYPFPILGNLKALGPESFYP